VPWCAEVRVCPGVHRLGCALECTGYGVPWVAEDRVCPGVPRLGCALECRG
jgi:hypothetical protein